MTTTNILRSTTHGNRWKLPGNAMEKYGNFWETVSILKPFTTETQRAQRFCNNGQNGKTKANKLSVKFLFIGQGFICKLMFSPRTLRLCGGFAGFPNSLAYSEGSCKTATRNGNRSGNRNGNEKRQKGKRSVNRCIGEWGKGRKSGGWRCGSFDSPIHLFTYSPTTCIFYWENCILLGILECIRDFSSNNSIPTRGSAYADSQVDALFRF